MVIKTLSELLSLKVEWERLGKSTALVCGCFDIIHLGHIELFRLAKSHGDILIVGIDNDNSIKLSKGDHRPIHDLKTRLEQIKELRSVDYVFTIDSVMEFGTDKSYTEWKNMLVNLSPNYLVTCQTADNYFDKKVKLAEDLNIQIINFNRKNNFSTSRVEQLYLESY